MHWVIQWSCLAASRNHLKSVMFFSSHITPFKYQCKVCGKVSFNQGLGFCQMSRTMGKRDKRVEDVC